MVGDISHGDADSDDLLYVSRRLLPLHLGFGVFFIGDLAPARRLAVLDVFSFGNHGAIGAECHGAADFGDAFAARDFLQGGDDAFRDAHGAVGGESRRGEVTINEGLLFRVPVNNAFPAMPSGLARL